MPNQVILHVRNIMFPSGMISFACASAFSSWNFIFILSSINYLEQNLLQNA
jgi:hypothetical protein